MTDDIDSVKTLLSDGWTAGNTDSVTPTFTIIYEAPRGDLAGNKDLIYFYDAGYTQGSNAFGTSSKQSTTRITVDVRCGNKPVSAVSAKDHFDKVWKEALRILDTKNSAPFTGADVLETINTQNFSNRNRGIYRKTLDVEIKRYNATRP